jgi:VWFA-related protein
MRAISKTLIAFFFCVSIVSFAQQQTPQAQEPSPQSSVTAVVQTPTAAQPTAGTETSAPADDHRVWLDVVVTDKAGNPQPGLQQQDFTILDDKLPQSILSFHATDQSTATDDPIQVIFLVDAVNIGVQLMGYERLELGKFLQQDGGHLPVPASLVFLTDTAIEIQPTATRDGDALAQMLNSKETDIRNIGRLQGYSGGVDRFNMSLGALERLAAYEIKQPGRKLLVWLSPGWPLLSDPRVGLSNKNREWIFNAIVALSHDLRISRITLYSIDPLGSSDAGGFQTFYYESFLKGVSSSKNVAAGNLALQALAVQSGGKVFNSNNDLTKLIANCLIDAKAYYTLSFIYPPANHPDEYRSLEIKVDKPRLIARTRTGYYAQSYKDAGR